MRVLFVDDQPEILSGLRRMLRGLRKEWQMEFVEGSKEALALMDENPFDVVVSDMRMPGVDGVDLLAETMRRYPTTVRIILSGQAEQDAILRAAVPAHQYLSKPCDADTLTNTIARTCALRNTMSQEPLLRVASQVSTIPSLPHIYSQLQEEMRKDDASVQVVADLIAQDVGMSAKLMQMVNSSFFGMPRRVESPAKAAKLLGLSILKPLVLSAGVFSQFDINHLKWFSANDFMDNSMAESVLAQKVAESVGADKQMAEDAMIAGMFQSIGQLLLVANLPDEYQNVLKVAEESHIALCDAEFECFGASRHEIGAYLLSLWGFKDSVIEAVAFCRQPSRSDVNEFSPLTAVHVATSLAENEQDEVGLEMDVDYLQRCGVADKLDAWRELAASIQSARCASV